MYKILFILISLSSMCFSQIKFNAKIDFNSSLLIKNVDGERKLVFFDTVKVVSSSDFTFIVDSMYSKLILSEVKNGVTVKSDTFALSYTEFNIKKSYVYFTTPNCNNDKFEVTYYKNSNILVTSFPDKTYKDKEVKNLTYYDLVSGGENLLPSNQN